jgi:MFS family permease
MLINMLSKKSSPQKLLTLLGFGTAISLLGDATLYTVLPSPAIAAQAGVTLALVGILLGVNRAIRVVLNGPVGMIYDRLPRRGLLVVSLMLGAGASVVYALGYGFWPLFWGRILWGVAWSLLWVGGNAMVLDVSTDADRGRNSGQYQMWFFIGVAGASFLGGLFTDLLGFRGGLWLSAVFIGAAAILWLLFLPETRPAQPLVPSQEKPRVTQKRFDWWVVAKAAFPIFVYRFVIAGVIASTTVLWLENLFGNQFNVLGLVIPLATASGLFRAVVTLISVVGAPVAGFWSDKIGKRWPVLGLTSIFGSIGLWLMSLNFLSLGILGGFLSQVTGGSIGALVPAISGDQVDKTQHGRAIGVIYTIGDLGSTLGPPIALGLLNTGTVTINWIYQGCALIFVFLGIFSWLQARQELPLQVKPKGV